VVGLGAVGFILLGRVSARLRGAIERVALD
jgi:hypothetical protein